MKRQLFLLYFALAVSMIGFGVTLPALPFFVDRLALGDNAPSGLVAFHVGALTSAYALAQLLTAPLWGAWSDAHGRKSLVMIGLTGFALAQAVFGLGTSLPLLYGARLAGGLFSGALLTASLAYVADTVTDDSRAQGMAWLGTAQSVGVVVGPVLSGFLTQGDWHVEFYTGHFAFDGFSIPFFFTAGLAAATVPVIFTWLPESRRSVPASMYPRPDWRRLIRQIKYPLVFVLFSQGLLALFEATFSLYAGKELGLGLTEIGLAYAICGLVMAVFQGGASSVLSRLFRSRGQISTGFFLLGTGFLLLLMVRSLVGIYTMVALLALGVALIAPNLLTLIANRSGNYPGAGLGLRNAFGSAGQVAGPLLGGILFAADSGLPYVLAAATALSVSVVIYSISIAMPESEWCRGIATRPQVHINLNKS